MAPATLPELRSPAMTRGYCRGPSRVRPSTFGRKDPFR